MNVTEEHVSIIAQRLKQTGALERYSGKEDAAEIETAQAVCDIVESAEKLVAELFPRLLTALETAAQLPALHDFREEIRHIIYHVLDSEYFSVVTAGLEGSIANQAGPKSGIT